MNCTERLANVISIDEKKKRSAYEPILDSKGNKIPHFTRHRDSGVIYIRRTFRKLGIPPIQCSTGEITLGKARTKAEILIQQHKNKFLGIDDSKVFGRRLTKTFREVANWVLKNHTPEQRKGTQQNHELYIPQLINVLGDRDINSISSPDSLKEVIESVKKRKRFSRTGKPLPTRTTFMDYAKSMNLIMRHAYQNKWASHHIQFKNPDKIKETGRLLNRTEVNKLWEAMNEDTRDQFVLALECVMRLREAICAPWFEVNLETGEWTIPKERVKTGSRTGKGRSFVVSPNALSRLRERYKNRDKRSPWIFPSPKDINKPIWSTKTAWKTAKEKAGIQGSCRWHDLRHTGLTWMLLGDPDASPKDRKKMIRQPLLVSAYAGVSMKTIETVYLKRRASQTVDVSNAVSIF